MAITIRNKETEAMIRRIGKRRNEGPSAVVKRLAEQELRRESGASQEEYERRMTAWDRLMAITPPREPDVTWQDLENEMESLFDYMEDEGSGLKRR